MTQLELPGLPQAAREAVAAEWSKNVRKMFEMRGERIFRVRNEWRYGWVQSHRPMKWDAQQLVECWHVRGFI